MMPIDARFEPADVSSGANPADEGREDRPNPAQAAAWADNPLGERLCDNVPLVSMTLVSALLGSLMVLIG